MTDQNDSEQTRRTFVKGAAATGVAATGLTAFSTSAAAQQNIRNLPVNISEQDGLLNVNVQNVNALNNINVEDVVVTVIGGDVLSDINVNIEDVNVEIIDDINVENVLNNNVVQVAVVALSDTGDIVAQGSDALNL